jgi:hypothetical protein
MILGIDSVYLRVVRPSQRYSYGIRSSRIWMTVHDVSTQRGGLERQMTWRQIPEERRHKCLLPSTAVSDNDDFTTRYKISSLNFIQRNSRR